MTSKINSTNPLTLHKSPVRKPNHKSQKLIRFSSHNPESQTTAPKTTQLSKDSCNNLCSVSFKTLGAGKLGISRYPDFEYNPQGGCGAGTGTKVDNQESNNEISVLFDVKTLYIPPLTNETTKFLGLPLPPFLRIDILPEVFQGTIGLESGKVDFEFTAKFCFSTGSLYRAPPLVVKTVLTTEESQGEKKSGRGERMDSAGKCRLVGVAKVDPVDDLFMNSFLGLPTECLAVLNAIVSVTDYQPKL